MKKKSTIGLIVLGLLSIGTVVGACGFLTDCSPNTNSGYTFVKEAAVTEVNQNKLINAVPIPNLETSQERKNLVKRLDRFNTEDKVSYIYLINYGKVMAFYTIKGKVSSVNSLITNPDQLVDARGRQCSQSHDIDASQCQKVASPDIDGSYGSKGDAIFFFTTDDVYVEWLGDYMLADQALKLTQQPEFIRQIK